MNPFHKLPSYFFRILFNIFLLFMLGLIAPSQFSTVHENTKHFWTSHQNTNPKGTDTYYSELFAATDNEINSNRYCTVKLACSLFPIVIIAQSMLWSYQSESKQNQLFEKDSIHSVTRRIHSSIYSEIFWGPVSRAPVSNAFMFQNIPVLSVYFKLIIFSFRYRCLFVLEMFVTLKFDIISIIFTNFSHIL
jgi:hypothetical protein